MPQTNPAGLTIIKDFEECVLFAYDDAVYPSVPFKPGDTLQGTLTIGWGHTGSDVHAGQVITQAQADQLLFNDLHAFEVAVNNLCAHAVTPDQFSAMVSFAFNEGAGSLARSQILEKLNQIPPDLEAAANDFGNWVTVDGVTNPDLVKRRAAERALFLGKPLADPEP